MTCIMVARYSLSVPIHAERQRSQTQAMSQSAVGGDSLGEQHNQKSSIDQSSSDKEPDKPNQQASRFISNAIISSLRPGRGTSHLHTLLRTSVSVYSLRPAESIKSNNISDASEARSSSHDLARHSLDRRTLDHRDGRH